MNIISQNFVSFLVVAFLSFLTFVPVAPFAQAESGSNRSSPAQCLADQISQGSAGAFRSGSYDWAKGEFCVARPLKEVWAVLHNQPLLVWDGVSSSTFQVSSAIPQGATHHYTISYKVKKFITVTWDMDWIHYVLNSNSSNPKEDPRKVRITYQKINGTHYIPFWEGEIVLNYLSPSMTLVTIENKIKASQTNAEDAAGTVKDLAKKMRTGAPNWTPVGTSQWL